MSTVITSNVSVWDLQLRRCFACADRTAWIILAAMRDHSGQPRFSILWTPDKPARLTTGDIEHFDRMRAQAQAELLVELERLR